MNGASSCGAVTKQWKVTIQCIDVYELAEDLIHNKAISDFQALTKARVPVDRLELVTEDSVQISGWIRYLLCHRSIPFPSPPYPPFPHA
ncbi:hypothetical protein PoB_003141900, partial [Plakobranchus ocellatus]